MSELRPDHGTDNPLYTGRLVSSTVEEDGILLTETRLEKEAGAIAATTPREAVSGGTWTQVNSKAVSDLLAFEVIQSRTLPGPAKLTYQVNNYGQIETTTTQYVDPAGASLTASATTTGGSITLKSASMAVKKQTTIPDVFAGYEYSVRRDDAVPARYYVGQVISTESYTTAGQSSMPTISGLQIAASEQDLTIFTKRVSTSYRATDVSGTTLTGHEVTTQWGGGVLTVTGQYSQNILTVDQGWKVTESAVLALGGGGYEKVTKQLDTGTIWPPIVTYDIDPVTGIVIEVTKQVLDSTTINANSSGIIAGAYVEHQALDKWRTLRISSKVDTSSLASLKRTWYGTHAYQFPDVLLAVDLAWAYAYTQSDFSYESKILFRVKSMAIKQCPAKFVRTFLNSEPTEPSIYSFQPQEHTIFHTAWKVNTAGKAWAGVTTAQTPLAIHGAISLPPGFAGEAEGSGSGEPFTELTPTSPADWPTSFILVDQQTEQWRLGIWVQTEIFVKLPT